MQHIAGALINNLPIAEITSLINNAPRRERGLTEIYKEARAKACGERNCARWGKDLPFGTQFVEAGCFRHCSSECASKPPQIEPFEFRQLNGVGHARLPNQVKQLAVDRWPSRRWVRFPAPVSSKAATVPSDDGLGPDNLERAHYRRKRVGTARPATMPAGLGQRLPELQRVPHFWNFQQPQAHKRHEGYGQRERRACLGQPVSEVICGRSQRSPDVQGQ